MMRRKRKGYAITIEVIFTLSLIAMMTNVTIYILTSYNTVRYMDTVMTSTTVQIAKWGGTQSNAYLANDMDYDVISNARHELNKTASFMSPSINGGPNKVTKGNSKVWVEMTWTQPSILMLPAIQKKNRLEMESIMRPGNLL